MKIIYLRKITVLLFLFALLSNVTYAQKANWRSLFNGKDLKNWDTYLKPSPAAADQTPIGLNNDPRHVFSVVDGTMRISYVYESINL